MYIFYYIKSILICPIYRLLNTSTIEPIVLQTVFFSSFQIEYFTCASLIQNCSILYKHGVFIMILNTIIIQCLHANS